MLKFSGYGALVVVVMVLLAGCGSSDRDDNRNVVLLTDDGVGPYGDMPSDELVARFGAEALVTDATSTLRCAIGRTTQAPTIIGDSCWVGTIAQLQPMQVRNHRGNLMVVMNSTDGVDRGLYLVAFIGGYMPSDGDYGLRLRQIEGGAWAFELARH
ncbi:MAG: hypothetical protein JW936_00805 [Sedimentisphaerales bacterium]|nr:hypothetical protein [Sedimentisphaerales bacterium]